MARMRLNSNEVLVLTEKINWPIHSSTQGGIFPRMDDIAPEEHGPFTIPKVFTMDIEISYVDRWSI